LGSRSCSLAISDDEVLLAKTDDGAGGLVIYTNAAGGIGISKEQTMRARPVRSRIFLPVIKLGLVSDDWPWVAVISFAGFMLPYLFWKFITPAAFLRVPIFLWVGLIVSASSYSFFYAIRVGRKPKWFQHWLKKQLEADCRRGTLPADLQHREPSYLKGE
jgi:hypothetical protein